MADWLVETNQLSKHYHRVAALTDCTLQVRRGEILGLLGPNGSGKTTLLRLLMGFLRPSSGWARVDGLDCTRQYVAVHARTAYLPGEVRLFRRMRGRDVLDFFCRYRPQARRSVASEIAQRFDLDLSRQVARCSSGMRQKLGLAMVLSIDAPLLILDEPTNNLDPTARSDVLSLCREAQQAGRTVLFSSHVLSEVENLCDRVVLLRAGRVVEVQPMAALRRRHRIRARLAGPLPAPPPELQWLHVQHNGAGQLQIETHEELAPLLRWLSLLPLTEVQIEPIGLQALYNRHHGEAAP
jgi:ABC-2 type transport system ATP-binding protein